MEFVEPSVHNLTRKSRHFASVLGIFCNERHVLREWIEHYLSFGFTHIYLIDNNSTDRPLEILMPYIRAGLVELFHCRKSYYQIGCYTEMLPRLVGATDWIGTFDLDEFVYCPQDINIGKILKDVSSYDSLLVPWLSFGSNGHLSQPPGLVQNFTRRGEASCGRSFLKAICRPEMIRHYTQHNPKLHSNRRLLSNGAKIGGSHWIQLQEEDVRHFFLINNHYRLQSRDYFQAVKCTRPEVNERVEGTMKSMEFFERHDAEWNTVLDERLANLSRMRQRAGGAGQVAARTEPGE